VAVDLFDEKLALAKEQSVPRLDPPACGAG
jgi:hypothetical protein